MSTPWIWAQWVFLAVWRTATSKRTFYGLLTARRVQETTSPKSRKCSQRPASSTSVKSRSLTATRVTLPNGKRKWRSTSASSPATGDQAPRRSQRRCSKSKPGTSTLSSSLASCSSHRLRANPPIASICLVLRTMPSTPSTSIGRTSAGPRSS